MNAVSEHLSHYISNDFTLINTPWSIAQASEGSLFRSTSDRLGCTRSGTRTETSIRAARKSFDTHVSIRVLRESGCKWNDYWGQWHIQLLKPKPQREISPELYFASTSVYNICKIATATKFEEESNISWEVKMLYSNIFIDVYWCF